MAETATKKPGKQPQDRKPAEDEAPPVPTGPPEGHELLKAYADVKASDQIRMLGALERFTDPKTGKVNLGGSGGFSMRELEVLADLFDLVEKYGAKDPDEFAAFTAGGMDGITRASNLVIWWVSELGE